ncbi:MAG: hypothetical protein KVP17_004270 [Porospora cf. gigantea B]|uniref:uncharacterized protein n=1 Tax=Porospora cf. gigantea B TaxID=2853592 RepID=UPI003571E5A5|nr:MAG: hypothetical protein KVP17_004270 [Porospora cf. gigantea B]
MRRVVRSPYHQLIGRRTVTAEVCDDVQQFHIEEEVDECDAKARLEAWARYPDLLRAALPALWDLAVYATCAGLVWFLCTAVMSDVHSRLQLRSRSLESKSLECQMNFKRNHCDPRSQRPPALESICNQWKECVETGAISDSRTKVTAEILAETCNSFFGSLTWITSVKLVIAAGVLLYWTLRFRR